MTKNKRIKDETNKQYFKLFVLEPSREKQKTLESPEIVWKCKCNCGRITFVRGSDLRGSKIKSCGKCGKNIKNIAGQKFGKLTILENTGLDKHGQSIWMCLCDCGNMITLSRKKIITGNTKSCGCLKFYQVPKNRIDMTNKKYGRLTGIKYVQNSKWLFNCECGNTKIINAKDVRQGKIKSCGCLKIEKCKESIKKLNLSGQDSPRWDKTKTNEERISKRMIPKIILWRQDVYKRDNYTCQICGYKDGGILISHHLDGYHWCKEKRIQIDNGITLCKNCHLKFHKIYGYKNNTNEQFLEFKRTNQVEFFQG